MAKYIITNCSKTNDFYNFQSYVRPLSKAIFNFVYVKKFEVGQEV